MCDLTDLNSLLEALNKIKSQHTFDIFCLNSGTIISEFKAINEVESTIVINHLSHHLTLKVFSSSFVVGQEYRVVVTSSAASHSIDKINWSDVNNGKK